MQVYTIIYLGIPQSDDNSILILDPKAIASTSRGVVSVCTMSFMDDDSFDLICSLNFCLSPTSLSLSSVVTTVSGSAFCSTLALLAASKTIRAEW